MSEDRLTRAESIFQVAADVPPGDRAAFLAEHCGDDPALRDLVEDLQEAAHASVVPLQEVLPPS